MASHDVDFDVAAANSWKIEVEMELQKVEQVLKSVEDVCSAVPGEKDTFMVGLQEVGKVMTDAWNGLCEGFNTMCEKIGELFKEREDGINTVTDNIDTYKTSFHL